MTFRAIKRWFCCLFRRPSRMANATTESIATTQRITMSAAEEFADLKFKIECSEIVLTKGNNPPIIVRGPGEIWQNVNGILQFKLFVREESWPAFQQELNRPLPVGQLLEDDDYFSLEAHDVAGPVWTAENILPSSRGGLCSGLAHGEIAELFQSGPLPHEGKSDHITVKFRGRLNFPCNQGTETVIRVGGRERHTSHTLNAAFADHGDYHFEVFHESEHTSVRLRLPVGTLRDTTWLRIHEALQFVLGEQIAPMVVETYLSDVVRTRLRSPYQARGGGKIAPPLYFRRLDDGGHVWRMFCTYFAHIFEHPDARWHPISRQIGSIIEASAGTIDAEISALAIGVEGLIGDCFPNMAPPSPDLLADLGRILPLLTEAEVSQATRSRVEGSLNAMRASRNSDKLRAFITNRNMVTGLYNSWGRLRHTGVHGGGLGGRAMAENMRLRDEVLFLMYSIVFDAISYFGPRTDYSTAGFPLRDWLAPPTSEPAQPQP